jgi:leucyl aminopeptidase (aminopeptidase T)
VVFFRHSYDGTPGGNVTVGVIVAPQGWLIMVVGFTIEGGKIVEMEAIANPEHLRRLDLAVLSD